MQAISSAATQKAKEEAEAAAGFAQYLSPSFYLTPLWGKTSTDEPQNAKSNAESTIQSYLKQNLDFSIYCVGAQRMNFRPEIGIHKKKRNPGVIRKDYTLLA